MSLRTFNKTSYTFLIFIGVLNQSCEVINPAEPIPSYLKINSVTLAPSDTFGSSSNKITDLFINIDTRYQGAYELPANFPLIENGAHEMIFYPGIIFNGTSNTRGVYPFYKPYTQTVVLESGKSVEVTPAFEYYNFVICEWCEDFEGAGFGLTSDESSDTGMIHIQNNNPEIFEGNGSGAVFLDASHPYFEIATSESYVLPIFGQSIMLEINYKCNQKFTVGIVANTATVFNVPVLIVNTKETWNKLYIDLGSVVRAYADAIDFKIYITGTKEFNVPFPEFYFDNFKLLHD